jgi:hypothetical protein
MLSSLPYFKRDNVETTLSSAAEDLLRMVTMITVLRQATWDGSDASLRAALADQDHGSPQVGPRGLVDTAAVIVATRLPRERLVLRRAPRHTTGRESHRDTWRTVASHDDGLQPNLIAIHAGLTVTRPARLSGDTRENVSDPASTAEPSRDVGEMGWRLSECH